MITSFRECMVEPGLILARAEGALYDDEGVLRKPDSGSTGMGDVQRACVSGLAVMLMLSKAGGQDFSAE